MKQELPSVKTVMPDMRRHLRSIADSVNIMQSGKLNCVGKITLNVSATTTSLIDNNISPQTVIVLMPLTANAATALASVFYTGVTNGSITINHASSANADQSFRYLRIG